MRTLLAMPNLRLYFLSTFVSSLGDYALWLAAAVWVKELTGSTSESGLSMLCFVIGSCLSPATGIVVDRCRRKPLLLMGNASMGLLVLALLFVHGPRQVWLIFTVMFLYGVGSSLNSGADTALIAQLAPEELLGTANGLAQALVQGLRLISPTIGIGLLSLFGGGALAIADAATFAVAIACWALIKVDELRPQPQGTTWRAETTAGFVYLARTPVLRQMTIAFAVAIFGIGFYETLGIAISTVGLHHAPSWVGVIVTSMGVTGAVGGLTAGPLMQRLGTGLFCTLGLVLAGLAALVIAIPYDVAVVGAGMLFGLSLPWIIVSSMTAIQLNTPNELLGRVSGADNFIVTIVQALGVGAGAALVSVFYYRTLCHLVAALAIVAALYLGTRKEQRGQTQSLSAVGVGVGVGVEAESESEVGPAFGPAISPGPSPT